VGSTSWWTTFAEIGGSPTRSHAGDGQVAEEKGYLTWFKAFSNGLLLGLLSERWKELAKVCAWVEADLPHEYLGRIWKKR
jgi:hypothetical protein